MGGLIIAGERSGAGKTTVTLGILAALRQRFSRVQSFKVGPDYIDPMFHHSVTGRPCYNLDPILTSPAYVQASFAYHSRDAEGVLVEGVMGLFDGATGVDDTASTAQIARLLNLPVLLVIDCSHLSRSVAALVQGYRSFDPRVQIAGVVLNRVGSDRHLELLQAAIAPLNCPIVGVLHRQQEIMIPDRHLGLVPTAELPGLYQVVSQLAALVDRSFDWDWLRSRITRSGKGVGQDGATPPHPLAAAGIQQPPMSRARIGVARDRAFSFYYPDNLEILESLGAEMVSWSPLEDRELPQGIQGMYFGGGFPEVFAAQLAANKPMREQVRQAVQAGMPVYGECGGLMYLCDRMVDFEGASWPMVGVLPTTGVMGKRLTLGYRRATARRDSPLMASGTQVWGHEFHRSTLTTPPEAPLYDLRRYDGLTPLAPEGWQVYQAHASYVHLHWGGCPAIAAQFIARCAAPSPVAQLPTEFGK